MPSSKTPPDEKSGVRPRDGLSEDLAQKSESLAREHSQKREIRLRQERVRHLSSEPEPRPRDGGGGPSSGSMASSGASSSNVASSGKVTGRVAATSGRANRIDDFPVDGDPPPQPSPPSRAAAIEPLQRGPQGVSVDDRPQGVVDEVAVELEELIRDMRAGWRRLESADRITFVAGLSTLCGVFLPWVSDPAHPTFPQIGLFAGGMVHAALAIAALALVVRRSRGRYDPRGVRMSRREQAQHARRSSLWHILLGAASTFFGIYFLVLLILARAPDWNVKVHFGLYWTLISGTGLSYGGFARFLRRED